MNRWIVGTCLVLALAGCAKPDLAHTVVRAGTTEELAEWRAEVGRDFGAAALADFDLALKELQLDAMERGIPTADAREGEMRSHVNHHAVRAAEVLGWEARRARLQREMKLMRELLERDRKKETDARTDAGRLEASTHVRNEQDILQRLETQLAETERKLAEWAAAP